MPDIEIVAVIFIALVGGIVTFSIAVLHKISAINEQSLVTKSREEEVEKRLSMVEQRISRLWERVEEVIKQQYKDTYRIDELKRKDNNNPHP